MWGKNKRKDIAKSHNVPFETLISSKTSMEGDIQFSGGLHIDGLIKGTIRSTDDQEAVVRISDIGEIDGDVIAPHIIINGTVYGDVYASKHVELAENASVKGNVYYNLIEMAMGAEVNGNLVHQKQPSPEDQVVGDKENVSDAVALKAVASQGE
ncbi:MULTISPECIES: polymer-forming cytoskeletal protein [unclassified Oleiphilus]|nr:MULTISPECIES: polymer-forming cytoskeletal protein [unclassified Oleiphilus]MCH2158170.1 polymer-forming cytoskeletal protein [Oleiphilaceae bacterium]KZY63460.1 cell shape determination protein CcmA [Oleiphilus sp. HI0066]KZY67781.1 cell shape determination protein CcmA [Oleiphilus sp. HI0067]KZY69638.1 cell shape determination protein CcmA [Oleiphilus sp. HI0066]KZY70881.1 cell shape determination protein CcmA [Oleiphilus sp. HI0067]